MPVALSTLSHNQKLVLAHWAASQVYLTSTRVASPTRSQYAFPDASSAWLLLLPDLLRVRMCGFRSFMAHPTKEMLRREALS